MILQKRGLSIISMLVIYFLIAMSIIVLYGTLHVYFEGTSSIKASFSIYFSYIYVSPRESRSFLSILITNSGAVDLRVTSIEVDKETLKLPVEGMNGTNMVRTGGQSYIDIPLKNEYEAGKSYDLSIVTDPPAEYTKVKAIATLKTWG